MNILTTPTTLSLVFDKPKSLAQRHEIMIKHLATNGNLIMIDHYIDSFRGITKDFSRRDLRQVKNGLKNKGKDALALKAPGSILRLMDKLFDAKTEHSPSHIPGWIGIEIECCIPRKPFSQFHRPCDYANDTGHDDRCVACGGLGVVYCRDHGSGGFFDALQDRISATKTARVCVKHDSSISPPPDYFGAEITCLVHRNDRTNLIKLCATLKEIGAIVNKSTGLHVHIDQRDLLHAKDLTHRTINGRLNKRGENFEKCLPLLLSLVPKSRRDNSYCKPCLSKIDRYVAINLAALKKFKTIEIRLHSGTVDATKINNWIDLLLQIESMPRIKKRIEFISQLKLNPDLASYFLTRQDLFRDSNVEN